MSAVDFEAWAVPDLKIELGGRTFTVRPPSVDAAKKLLAAAVRAEVNLGIVEGPVPEEVQRVLDTIGKEEHPALGAATYQEMVDAGVHPVTIDRTAYYAVFYWARGKAYADWLAAVMWSPEIHAEGEATPAPKAQPTSRRKSGRRTGSANRSTTTRTASPSTATTESPPKPSPPPRPTRRSKPKS